jgi:hypothetical protein
VKIVVEFCFRGEQRPRQDEMLSIKASSSHGDFSSRLIFCCHQGNPSYFVCTQKTLAPLDLSNIKPLRQEDELILFSFLEREMIIEMSWDDTKVNPRKKRVTLTQGHPRKGFKAHKARIFILICDSI